MTVVVPFKGSWEKLPDDFVLDDEPADNLDQPALAAALAESLELAGRLPATALTITNYGICATVDQRLVVKAPDWGYVPSIRVSRQEIRRSYTPRLQGDKPVVVMEFLSDAEGGEYSSKPTYPLGKWFFYEQVLQILNYVIFEPWSGTLAVYRLDDVGHYQLRQPDEKQRYWTAEMNLFLERGREPAKIARVTGYAGGISKAIYCRGVRNWRNGSGGRKIPPCSGRSKRNRRDTKLFPGSWQWA